MLLLHFCSFPFSVFWLSVVFSYKEYLKWQCIKIGIFATEEHPEYSDRVYTVREGQGESIIFPKVRECQGKSGKFAIVRGKQHFCNLGQGKNIIFYYHRSI